MKIDDKVLSELSTAELLALQDQINMKLLDRFNMSGEALPPLIFLRDPFPMPPCTILSAKHIDPDVLYLSGKDSYEELTDLDGDEGKPNRTAFPLYGKDPEKVFGKKTKRKHYA